MKRKIIAIAILTATLSLLFTACKVDPAEGYSIAPVKSTSTMDMPDSKDTADKTESFINSNSAIEDSE